MASSQWEFLPALQILSFCTAVLYLLLEILITQRYVMMHTRMQTFEEIFMLGWPGICDAWWRNRDELYLSNLIAMFVHFQNLQVLRTCCKHTLVQDILRRSLEKNLESWWNLRPFWGEGIHINKYWNFHSVKYMLNELQCKQTSHTASRISSVI